MPDDNFEQALIDLGIDSDGIVNQQILRSDPVGVTALYVSNPTANPNLPNVNAGIADLTGIEAFVNLTTLHCSVNQLTSLDVSNGNNSFFTFDAIDNPSLFCIQVDNEADANAGLPPNIIKERLENKKDDFK